MSELRLPAGLTVVDPVAPVIDLEMLERVKKSVEPKPRTWRRCRDLVDAILARADEPWVKLQLGGDEICEVRSGGIVLLVGGTGRGKTSLAASILAEHAAEHGPAIAASLELPDDEWTARAIGSRREASWPDVLKGKLSRDGMLSALPERLAIVGRDVDAFEALEQAIDDMRAEYPDQPILVAVDYVQIAALDGDAEIRQKVGQVMRRIDRLARSKRVVVIALSQGSRVSSRALSSGEKIGADTTDSGAESADLERWATTTLAIGQLGESAADGTVPADISIGKGRMTGGDRVLPGRFDGRTGRWRLAGEARPASAVRAEKTTAQTTAKAGAARLAMVAAAERSATSLTREELRAAAATNRDVARVAITAALGAGELVEVRQRKPRTSAWQIWTPAKAKAAGIPTADAEVTE